MAAFLGRGISDLRAGGAYLPAILSSYLYLKTGSTPSLLFAVGSTIGAVVMHGIARGVFGPEGPEMNPLEESTTVQRMQVAILGKGPATKFPSSTRGMVQLYLNEGPSIVSPTRLLLIAFFGVTFIIWALSFPFTLLSLWSQVRQLEIVILVVYFAEVIWIFQWLIWRFIHPAYIYEQDPINHYGKE